MTTKGEIKRWTRPLLAWRPDLALVRHQLVIAPVRHVLRDIHFGSSRSKEYPHVHWGMVPLFKVPIDSPGYPFFNDIPVGSSAKSDFQELLETRTRHFIERVLTPLDTIEKFRDHTLVSRGWEEGGSFGPPLDRHARYHVPVLAALGLIEQASAVLRPSLEQEGKYMAKLRQEGTDLLARNARSGHGKWMIGMAETYEVTHAPLTVLQSLLDRRDRGAIAALLHEWERQNVKHWGIEHLWEPTPFPVELGAGD